MINLAIWLVEKLFFTIYLIIWLGHGWNHLPHTPETLAYVCGALATSILIHRYAKKGSWLTTSFILGHMVIEWVDLGQSWPKSNDFLKIFAGHAALDLVFFWTQLPERWGRWVRTLTTLGSLTALATTAVFVPIKAGAMGPVMCNHDHGPLSAIAWGGVLGCILWHLFKKNCKNLLM